MPDLVHTGSGSRSQCTPCTPRTDQGGIGALAGALGGRHITLRLTDAALQNLVHTG
jgi:hypothetical protein